MGRNPSRAPTGTIAQAGSHERQGHLLCLRVTLGISGRSSVRPVGFANLGSQSLLVATAVITGGASQPAEGQLWPCSVS